MKSAVIFATLAVFLAGSLPSTASAQSSSIRFYELHKRDGEKRVRAKKTDKAGCHNFKKNIELHRVGMIGFSWCTVYSEKNCAAGTEIPALWTGKRYRMADFDTSEPQTKLLRGSKWEFTDKDLIVKNDARRYHDKTRAKAKAERLEALNDLREAIESGDPELLESFFAESSYKSKNRRKKSSGFTFDDTVENALDSGFDDTIDNEFDAMLDSFEDEIEAEPLTPQERLEKLEKLQTEIAEIEKDYIEGLQRNVMAASWYCQAQ